MRRAFGASLPTDEELAISREITEFDRTLAVFEGKEMVATAGIFSYEMTAPGGTLPVRRRHPGQRGYDAPSARAADRDDAAPAR